MNPGPILTTCPDELDTPRLGLMTKKINSRVDEVEEEPELFKPHQRTIDRQQPSQSGSKLLSVNLSYIIPYVLCHALGVFYSSFSVAGNSQTTTIFQAKFGWTEDETMFYNTIISGSAMVGQFLGCISAGKLIQKGRRRGAVIANSIAIIGAGMTMIGTIPFLTFGRFSVGVAAGIYNVALSKMIVENMPVYLS